MRRIALVALVIGVLLPGGASAQVATGAARDTAPLIAIGGSALTNGVFFPGTAVYDGSDFQGRPYEIEKGTDIEFMTPDGSLTLGNGHRIISFKKRKNGRPLFQSKFISNGESTLMITSHLKPGKGELPDGSYAFRCTVHHPMFGMIKVTK